MSIEIYNYEVPYGWRDLVNRLCDELEPVLKKKGMLENYKVIQAKEKFGSLCWYDTINEPEIDSIINKYIDESKFTCCVCGDIAEWESFGYISPFCNHCVERGEVSPSRVIPIEEYYHLWDKE